MASAPSEAAWRGLGRQRRRVMGAIALASAAALAIWLGVDRLAAPVAGLEAPAARLGFAVGCICVAAIFCLVPGIEAVAHERLASPAIDPLAGYETRRLKVNQRYLQNTLEQFAVFAPALRGGARALHRRRGCALRADLAAGRARAPRGLTTWPGAGGPRRPRVRTRCLGERVQPDE